MKKIKNQNTDKCQKDNEIQYIDKQRCLIFEKYLIDYQII